MDDDYLLDDPLLHPSTKEVRSSRRFVDHSDQHGNSSNDGDHHHRRGETLTNIKELLRLSSPVEPGAAVEHDGNIVNNSNHVLAGSVANLCSATLGAGAFFRSFSYVLSLFLFVWSFLLRCRPSFLFLV
jgi:hypothetical protein